MALKELPQKCGVRPGMVVVLMADLTRMAWRSRRSGQAFSAAAPLDSFIHAVGPQGTVLVPTYNFDLRSGEAYDPLRTPPITGALGIAALAHPAFRRTSHPLHSFAVSGALADEFVQADDLSSFGPRSVFALLRERKAVQVALDLSLNDSFTYVHHVEEMEQVNYRRWERLMLHVSNGSGATVAKEFKRFAKRHGHSNVLHDLEPLLVSADVMRELNVDGTTALVIELDGAHAVVADDIRNNRARSIHHFSFDLWLRDTLRPFLRSRGASRSAKSLLPHAAHQGR